MHIHSLSMYACNVCINSPKCMHIMYAYTLDHVYVYVYVLCVCMCACVPGRPCACIASAPWGLAACSRLRAQFAKRAYTPLEYRYPFCLCNHVMNMLQILSYVAAVCCSAMREKSLHASWMLSVLPESSHQAYLALCSCVVAVCCSVLQCNLQQEKFSRLLNVIILFACVIASWRYCNTRTCIVNVLQCVHVLLQCVAVCCSAICKICFTRLLTVNILHTLCNTPTKIYILWCVHVLLQCVAVRFSKSALYASWMSISFIPVYHPTKICMLQ